jgi:endonuclease/exonuclease/phosphatase family metal-dependent hydrolase
MSQSFSIITYNVQAGIGTKRAHHYLTRAHNQFLSTPTKTRRLKHIGHFLSDFDVACLQEVDPGGRRAGFVNQGDIIRDASGHPHHVFQENRAVQAISRHGNAILSRIPIVRWEDLKLPGRISGRGALLVELDMEPATIIICAHLSLGVDDQIEQMEFLADQLNDRRHGRARKIICGDLNCSPFSAPVQRLMAMTNLQPLTAGRHLTYPAWAPRLALDHIITDDDPTHDHAIKVETPGYSDHRPVSASFRASIIRSQAGASPT